MQSNPNSKPSSCLNISTYWETTEHLRLKAVLCCVLVVIVAHPHRPGH